MCKEIETISYNVQKIIYRNVESGFAVLSGSVNEMTEIAVGELADLKAGEDWDLTGSFVEHPSFGRQFKVKIAQRTIPVTAKAVKNFLASGEIKGLGKTLASRIVNEFGDETLLKIEKDPKCLARIKGISKSKVEKLEREFEKLFAMRKLILFLESYGIEPQMSIKLYSKYGPLSVDAVKKNPYILCEPEIEVDFELADDMAAKLGIKDSSAWRIRSGLEYILRRNALLNGHTCIPRDIIVPVGCRFLKLERDEINITLDDMIKTGRLISYKKKKEFIFLPSYFTAEDYISGRLADLLDTERPDDAVINTLIDLEEERMGIKFVPLQRRAISQAVSNGVFLLTGGPGTGKTTILNAVISIMEQKGLNVKVCAPTGRAAKRLTELTGKEALTIHRMLGVRSVGDGNRTFVHNEHNKLNCDAVIVDEMSMVDCMLFYNLLKAINSECRLILTGDANQLPSVAAGNVLRELTVSDCIPSVVLKDIFRQSAKSLIVTNAHSIMKGELPEIGRTDSDFFFIAGQNPAYIQKTVTSLVSKRLPKAYHYSPRDDIQVICLQKKGALGTYNFNNLIQETVNPKSADKNEFQYGSYLFREGDKVMQIKNNYDIEWVEGETEGNGIFNGDIGVITKINKRNLTLNVQFDSKVAVYNFDLLKQLELAYAITVHKSQGNEFKSVVMPIVCGSTEFYNRNLLYTGITRAKEMLIIVGSAQSIADMTNQVRINYRYTNLKELIADKVLNEQPQD